MHFLEGIIWISIKISLKCFRKGPINNIPALAQIIQWVKLSAGIYTAPNLAITVPVDSVAADWDCHNAATKLVMRFSKIIWL